jgi:hypothetical protein
MDGDRLVAHEILEGSVYKELIEEMKRNHPRSELVHAYSAKEYDGMRMFVTPDGLAGVVVKPDGDVASLFKNPRAGSFTKHGFDLMRLATQEGGRKEDVFDIDIPDFDARMGFRAVARVQWNDEFAPDGWPYEKYAKNNGGRPDVVFLVYDPDKVLGEFKTYTRDVKPGLEYSTYDDAVAAQSEALSKIDAAQAAMSNGGKALFEPDQDLIDLFEDLDGSGRRKARAEAELRSHPRAQKIREVNDNILDLLQELEDSKRLTINC